MSNSFEYFDITIKHEYDSLPTKRKERKITTVIRKNVITVFCSVVLIFSNCVSSMAEAREEDIKGKAEYFPATLIKERSKQKGILPTINAPFISVKSSPENAIICNKVEIADVAVTNNESSKSKIKIKIAKKKAIKIKKKEKTKEVFANLNSKTQKAKAIWSYLKSEGFEEGAIAGILGNIEQESDFNEKHSKHNDETYKGLFQLSKNTRFKNCIEWCNKNNYDPWSVKGQIKFMLEELKDERARTYQFIHYTGYEKKEYMNIKNPEEAASIWVAGYEGAIESGYGLDASWQQEDKRRYYAKKWYNKFS